MSKLLSRDEILKVDDFKKERVHVPEWGGDVFVKTLTGTERDKFDELSVQGKGKNRDVNLANFRARLVAIVIVGDDNKTLFNETDVAVLGMKSAPALDRVYEAAAKLNRLTKEDVDELVGNSESAQSDDSGTSSVVDSTKP